MPQVEADLVIEIGKTQENLKKTIQLQTQIDTNNKKIAANSSASFKKVSADVDNVNKNLEKGAGFLSGLRDNLIKLKERRELAATAEQAKQLTDEIRKTELQIKQMEGTIDTFGKRQKRGLAEVTDSFFSVGQGAIGALNLINLLGDDGSNTTRTIVAATKALVLAESARTVVLGALKAAELSTLAVERVRAFFTAKKTVAAIADSGATAGQIAVSRLYGAATVQATVATKGFTAALLANPITAIAVGLAAVVGLLIAFSGASAKVTKQQIEDFERIRAIQDQITAAKNQTIEAALKLGEAEGRVTAAEADRVRENRRFAEDFKKIKKDEQGALLKLQKEFEDGSIKSENDYRSQYREIQRTSERLESENKKQHLDNLAAIETQGNKEGLDRIHKIKNLENSLIKNELDKQIADRREKAQIDRDAIAKDDKDRGQLIKLITAKETQDIIQIRNDAAKKLRDELIKNADAEDAIHKKILDAEKEFNTNRENLAIALRQALSDNDKESRNAQNAAEDALRARIKSEGINLTPVELDQAVADARLKVANEFLKIRSLLFRTAGQQQLAEDRLEANARIALSQDSFAKQMQTITDFNDQEEIRLLKLGQSMEEIDRAANARMLAGAVKFNEDRIQLAGKTAKDLVTARVRGNESEVSFEERKKIDLLKIDQEIAEAQKRLALNNITLSLSLGLEITPEQRAKLAEAEAAVTETTNAIKKALESIKPVSWGAIIGLSDKDAAAFDAAFNKTMTSIVATLSSGVDAAIAENDRLIEASKAIIGSMSEVTTSLSDQIKTAEDDLEHQLELQRQGLANNVDAKRQEITALKAEREREIAHLATLIAKKKALAKQQLRIDAAQQASALLLAGATVIVNWTKTGNILSIFGAIAEIAAIIAAFAAFKAKAAAIDSEGFYEGGYTGDGSARDVAGVTHKKEFVFDHKKTTEYRELFEKIHKDQPLTTKDLLPLLEGTGVVIPEETKKEISRTQTQITEHKTKEPNELREIKNQLVEMNETVSAMQERMENATESWNEPDGTTVLRTVKKGIERIKRIKKNG